MRRIRVRKHKRRKRTGGTTVIRQHQRTISKKKRMKAIPSLQDVYQLQESINSIENEIYALEQRVSEAIEGRNYETNEQKKTEYQLNLRLKDPIQTEAKQAEIEQLKIWMDWHNKIISQYKFDIEKLQSQIYQKEDELRFYQSELMLRGKPLRSERV